MPNLPASVAEELGKARTAGGGNWIQHGDYTLMIEKWYFQKIQDECIIVEFLVCELYCASVSAICLLLLSRS